MKTTFETKELLGFLKATKGIKNKAFLPAEYFYLRVEHGEAYVMMTNLDTFVSKTFFAEGEIYVVLQRELVEKHIAKSKFVVIETDGDKAKVNGLTMPIMDIDSFPIVPEFDNNSEGVLFSSAMLKEAKNAIPYLGNDELRPVMTGVYVSNENGFHDVVGTNAQMMFRSRIGVSNEADEKYSFLFNPRNIAKAIDVLKICDENVRVYLCSGFVMFVFENGTVMFERQIEGRFPNYEAVIPNENSIHVNVNVPVLIEAIEMVKVAKDSSGRIFLDIQTDRCAVKAENIDYNLSMKTDVQCESNDSLSIAFIYTYLISLLKSTISEDVVILLTNANRAAVIQDKHRTLLLMPAKLN